MDITAGNSFGMRLQWGLGNAYPVLRQTVQRIYADRVSSLPWVPRGWLAQVDALANQYPDDVVMPVPALVAGVRVPTAPAFVDSMEKAKAWQSLTDSVTAAVSDYAAKKAAEGQRELEQLYADVAFWNKALSIATAIRDFPANAVGAVADGVGSVATSWISRLAKSWVIWVVVIVAGGFVAWRSGAFRRRGQ